MEIGELKVLSYEQFQQAQDVRWLDLALMNCATISNHRALAKMAQYIQTLTVVFDISLGAEQGQTTWVSDKDKKTAMMTLALLELTVRFDDELDTRFRFKPLPLGQGHLVLTSARELAFGDDIKRSARVVLDDLLTIQLHRSELLYNYIRSLEDTNLDLYRSFLGMIYDLTPR